MEQQLRMRGKGGVVGAEEAARPRRSRLKRARRQ